MATGYGRVSFLAKVLLLLLVAMAPQAQPLGQAVSNGGGWQPVPVAEAAKKIEAYFDSLTTLQAEFTQHTSTEKFAHEGTFYLKRPRLFLWQYEQPIRQKVVSTGSAVYYVDQSTGSDGQVTQLPVNSGLARLFNGKTLVLADVGLKVATARQNRREFQADLAVDGKRDEAGVVSIRLIFDREAKGELLLREAAARDVTGAVTRVGFNDMQVGKALPDKMFDFTPGVYRER